MSPEEFRRHGRELIDFIADYWASLDQPAAPPVLSTNRPGDLLAALPLHPPESPEPFDRVLHDLPALIMPGLTHWQSPSFFGYFPANASAPSVLGELLSAGLGVQGMLWSTSPACTELETRVLDWLAQAINLPAEFLSTSTGGGIIQGTASEAALVAMHAARHRALQHNPHQPPPLIAYTSTQAHSSIAKAAMISGIASSPDPINNFLPGPHGSGLRLIPTLPDHRLDPAALNLAIRTDLDAGRQPFFITATVGTTSSSAFDDLAAIGPIARAHRCWLHVDAAYAGAAWICPEFRSTLIGIEHADSLCFNPHKWLLTNFDCTAFWTRDRAALTTALSITPEYLRNAASASGRVTDYRDWQIPLGRRFRALKLWFVLRHYGLSGLRTYIREHVRLANLFASLLAADPRFELAAPPALSLVCFRLAGADDAAQRRLLDALNATGKLFLTHTVLPTPGSPTPRTVLRLAIGSTHTREEHIHAAWSLIRAAADALVAKA
jgi:aromatic-L-amino-acid/L-tryptophan decarboxylase